MYFSHQPDGYFHVRVDLVKMLAPFSRMLTHTYSTPPCTFTSDYNRQDSICQRSAFMIPNNKGSTDKDRFSGPS